MPVKYTKEDNRLTRLAFGLATDVIVLHCAMVLTDPAVTQRQRNFLMKMSGRAKKILYLKTPKKRKK